MEKFIEQLLDNYSLNDILFQNDIDEREVVMILIDRGLIDPYDYFYKDVEELDEDD